MSLKHIKERMARSGNASLIGPISLADGKMGETGFGWGWGEMTGSKQTACRPMDCELCVLLVGGDRPSGISAALGRAQQMCTE